jgi:hypothetical protein
MKYSKSGFLPKVFLIAGIVLALYLLNGATEGFQGSNVVDLYFRTTTTGVPSLVSSSNSGVTFVSGSDGGNATLNIAPSLGTLKDFTGRGWSQAGSWLALPAVKLDKISNAIRIEANVGNTTKVLRKPTASGVVGNQLRLPQAVSRIMLKGLDTSTLGLGTTGDRTKGGAQIHVQLTF